MTESDRIYPSPHTREAGRPSSRHFTVVVGSLLCIFLGVFYWLSDNRKFPLLPVGEYIGEVAGLPDLQQGQPFRIYLHRTADELYAVVLRNGWGPSERNLDGIDPERTEIPPLKIVGNEDEDALVLTGNFVSKGHYRGEVRFGSGRREGSWELKRVTDTEVPQVLLSEDEVKWLMVYDQLEKVEQALDTDQKSLRDIEQRISEMERFITEGEELKLADGQSGDNARAQLTRTQELLNQKRTEVLQLLEKLRLAQRVTKMGTLVSLAREASERDGRWLTSMLRSEGLRRGSSVFEQQVSRARKVLELKSDIRRELQLIEELRLGRIPNRGSGGVGAISEGPLHREVGL